METFIIVFLVIFGLIVGSFLNVVILRMHKGRSFFSGRSQCFSCSYKLGVPDLVPLLSFAWLRGKCRKCKSFTSWQYPIVEFLTAFLFGFIGFEMIDEGSSLWEVLSAISLLGVFSCLIVILAYDFKHYIIPNVTLVVLGFFTVLFHLFSFIGVDTFEFEEVLILLGCGFLSSLAFYFLLFISKGKWMGGGDVKFIFLIGLLVGFPEILVALFLSFVIGALVGIVLMAVNMKKFKDEVPFAPFLILGASIAFFYGEQIADKYESLVVF